MTSSEITEREQRFSHLQSEVSIDRVQLGRALGLRPNRREHRAHTTREGIVCVMKRNKSLERVSILRSVGVEF